MKTRNIRWFTVASAILLTLAVAGCSGGSPGGSSSGGDTSTKKPIRELRLGLTDNTAVYGPIYYAMKKDLWNDYGLDVKLSSFTASAGVAALVAGDLDIFQDGPGVVDASLRTKKLTIIGHSGKLAFSLYAKDDIKSVNDLKGKTVGVTAPGGSIDTTTRSLMTLSGLKPDKDVKFLYTGSNAASLAALQQGSIAAATISPPTTLQAKALGLHEVVNLSKTPGILGLIGLCVANNKFMEDHPDVIVDFMKAYQEAVKRAIADPETTKVAIGEYTKTTDKALLNESFEAYKNLWNGDPHYPVEEVQAILDTVKLTDPQFKDAKPGDVLNNKFADEVTKNK